MFAQTRESARHSIHHSLNIAHTAIIQLILRTKTRAQQDVYQNLQIALAVRWPRRWRPPLFVNHDNRACNDRLDTLVVVFCGAIGRTFATLSRDALVWRMIRMRRLQLHVHC